MYTQQAVLHAKSLGTPLEFEAVIIDEAAQVHYTINYYKLVCVPL
jgi:hypothetical protein